MPRDRFHLLGGHCRAMPSVNALHLQIDQTLHRLTVKSLIRAGQVIDQTTDIDQVTTEKYTCRFVEQADSL
ncbi:hypothetical protein D3C72_1070330 [compost metagenome]